MTYFQNKSKKLEFPDENLIEIAEDIPAIPAMIPFTKKKRVNFFFICSS